MLAVGIKANVFLHQHFVVLVFILKKRGFGFVFRVQAAKNLFYVHFSHTMRSTFKAVIGQIKPQRLHNFAEMLFNFGYFFRVAQFKSIFAQWCIVGTESVVIAPFVNG